MSVSRLTMFTLALAAGFAVGIADLANARVGGSGSFGSRGTRTYTKPPETTTAPKATPIEKSITQKGAQPQVGTAGQTSSFGGWRGLLMGGLFAAGLASIFGFGALASVLGFVLQFALIAGAVFLVVGFIRSRTQTASTPASAFGSGAGAARDPLLRQSLASASSTAPAVSALPIGKADLDTFEKLLGDIQTAYGREDVEQIGALTTPEMLSHFSEELSDTAKQGLRNEVSDVKLLQGDLSEAWREGDSEYATVAMRFSLIDATVDRKTGRVVSGDRERPMEATEFWTFRRDDRARTDGWQLSAIQQAA